MSTENNTTQKCPQCENQCPREALQCGKGRRYFGIEPEEKTAPDSLLGLLRQCGHTLHHAGGGREESELFQMLSEAERAELQSLLQKVMAGWQELFPQTDGKGCGHQGNHSGRRHQ